MKKARLEIIPFVDILRTQRLCLPLPDPTHAVKMPTIDGQSTLLLYRGVFAEGGREILPGRGLNILQLYIPLFINFLILIDFREGGRERNRETLICYSTHLCIH